MLCFELGFFLSIICQVQDFKKRVVGMSKYCKDVQQYQNKYIQNETGELMFD